MFFSIIVPTYNPSPFLKTLLDSILKNECSNDVEIILSDDCSEETFFDILTEYSNLDIKFICNNEHSGFPRNGRQHGAEIASGKWICFVDQDDYFLDNGLDIIKTYIETHNAHNYLGSDFLFYIEGADEARVCSGTEGWTHGKFYEKTFWDQYDICFDNVQYCEDINLSTKIGCIMLSNKIKFNHCTDVAYVWNRRYDSLSMVDQYFEKSMPDYIVGTLGVIARYMEQYKGDSDAINSLIPYFINTLYHIYFYFQDDSLMKDRKYILNAALIIDPIYSQFKSITGYTTQSVILATKTDYSSMYAKTRSTDYALRPFVEQMTFEDWMKAYLN